jgi:hypothetical protein
MKLNGEWIRVIYYAVGFMTGALAMKFCITEGLKQILEEA